MAQRLSGVGRELLHRRTLARRRTLDSSSASSGFKPAPISRHTTLRVTIIAAASIRNSSSCHQRDVSSAARIEEIVAYIAAIATPNPIARCRFAST